MNEKLCDDANFEDTQWITEGSKYTLAHRADADN